MQSSTKSSKAIFYLISRSMMAFLIFYSPDSYAQQAAPSVTTKNLKKFKRILFLGNSITYSGEYIRDIEAFIRLEDPSFNSEIINLGLPSETVSGLSEPNHADGKFPRPDLHERLARILKAVKPDLVFACYGMNDGIYLPLDESRFEKFREGIRWLHDEVVNSGAKIIHITPPIFDERRGKAPGYENVLAMYSEWLMNQRQERKWEVIDLHKPMWNYLQKKIQAGDDSFVLAEDGVHPAEKGHWLMAQPVLKYLGFNECLKFESINDAYKHNNKPAEIVSLIRQRQLINRDAWLRETKHHRPGLATGLELQVAKDSVVVISKSLRRFGSR